MIVDLTKFPCSYCKKKIESNSDAKMCPHCHVVMHKKCWDANKGCTTPGCKGRFNSAAMDQVKPAVQPVNPKTLDPFFGMDRKGVEKTKQLLQKFGLEEVEDRRDVTSLLKIAAELSGSGFFEFGMDLNLLFGKSVSESDKLQVMLQKAMIEQNFIVIRQLDRINSNLKKLLEK